MKSEIAVVLGVETIERDLIVSATGFKVTMISLPVDSSYNPFHMLYPFFLIPD